MPILSFVFLWTTLMPAACVEETDVVIPAIGSERIDLIFSGAEEAEIHLESEDGLITAGPMDPPAYRNGEIELRLDLENDHTLRLIFYRAFEETVFEAETKYSAYPETVLEDRAAYVIADYVNDKDEILYSTTLPGSTSPIQPQVIEITSAAEDGFSARIYSMILFRTEPEARSAGSADDLTVQGTFVARF